MLEACSFTALLDILPAACHEWLAPDGPGDRPGRGIVYFRDLQECIKARQKFDELRAQRPRDFPSIDTYVYHGDLSEAERRREMDGFAEDVTEGQPHYKLLFCTSAAATGVDVANVGFVIILKATFDVPDLVQVGGRARGRGQGRPALVRVLISSSALATHERGIAAAVGPDETVVRELQMGISRLFRPWIEGKRFCIRQRLVAEVDGMEIPPCLVVGGVTPCQGCKDVRA